MSRCRLKTSDLDTKAEASHLPEHYLPVTNPACHHSKTRQTPITWRPLVTTAGNRRFISENEIALPPHVSPWSTNALENAQQWKSPLWANLVPLCNIASRNSTQLSKGKRNNYMTTSSQSIPTAKISSKHGNTISEFKPASYASIARSAVSVQQKTCVIPNDRTENLWASPNLTHGSAVIEQAESTQNIDNDIFASPWLLRPGHRWAKKAHSQRRQRNKLCRLPPELLTKCTPEDAASRLCLASTCQMMLHAVCLMHTMWDIERGELCGHEGGQLKPNPLVIITSNYCDHEEVYQRSHRASLLTVTLNHHASTIRILELYRVPFLETAYIQTLLPKLTNLRLLGIYSCHLIGFSHTIPLLKAFSNGLGKRRCRVQLDFYPRRLHNKIFTRPQANISCVLPHLVKIIGVVQDLGIPLLNSDGAFLRFLSQPSLRLQGEPAKGKTGLRMFDKVLRYSKSKEWDDDLANWMKRQMWSDFSATTPAGANFRKLWTCDTCHIRLHGVFFPKVQHNKDNNRRCLGCIVEEYREEETTSSTHLGPLHRASRHWFSGVVESEDQVYKWEDLVERASVLTRGHREHLRDPDHAPDTILDPEGNVVVQPTAYGVRPVKITFEEFLETDAQHWFDYYGRTAGRRQRGGPNSGRRVDHERLDNKALQTMNVRRRAYNKRRKHVN